MVDININLDIEGDISDADLNIKLKILAELIINAVKGNIRALGLIDSGQYLQGWISEVKDGSIIIQNTTKHSDYLEFGTFGYWDKNGLDNFTDPSDPKKRDLSSSAKLSFPKGMQSFAPLRKVVFNEGVMQGLVDQAFS